MCVPGNKEWRVKRGARVLVLLKTVVATNRDGNALVAEEKRGVDAGKLVNVLRFVVGVLVRHRHKG